MELKYKHLYKTVLKEYQNLSKCARVKVAALVVEKGRIISCGYNGTPAGQFNCDQLFMKKDDRFYRRPTPDSVWEEVTEQEWKDMHHEFSEHAEIHAEMNAIGYAAKWKIDLAGASIVLSHEPCENCAKLIYVSGLKEVMYINKYDRGSRGIEFLENAGVKVEQI